MLFCDKKHRNYEQKFKVAIISGHRENSLFLKAHKMFKSNATVHLWLVGT